MMKSQPTISRFQNRPQKIEKQKCNDRYRSGMVSVTSLKPKCQVNGIVKLQATESDMFSFSLSRLFILI